MSAFDIFISYSSEDRARARSFADALTAQGFSVWWDNALHSGETFDEVIERQLRAAKAVVVLWSPNSVSSRWVRAEATLADRRSKLAPVIIEPCDRPIIFELTHTVDLSHWAGDENDPTWRNFLTDLHHLVEKADGLQAQAAPTAPTAPTVPAAKPAAPASSGSVFAGFGGSPPGQDDEADYEATQFYTQATAARLFGGEQHVLEQVVEGTVDKSFVVGPLGAKIGRSAPAEIVLADPRVSRTHCMVELKDGELLVSDLGSTNGTYIDDEKILDATILPVGSVLQVGNFYLIHEVRASAEA